jgi:hypothetical protein
VNTAVTNEHFDEVDDRGRARALGSRENGKAHASIDEYPGSWVHDPMQGVVCPLVARIGVAI